MIAKSFFLIASVLGLAFPCIAQEKSQPKPSELEVLKGAVGVWDAEIEVWPEGPDRPPSQFKGVDTNRAYGEYWVASDFMGQAMKIHSIIGYDPDQKKMVRMNIDHGVYAAKTTGHYDKKSRTVNWRIEAKDATGKPVVQTTTVPQKFPTERVLVLMVPGKIAGDFTRFMQIKFVKRN